MLKRFVWMIVMAMFVSLIGHSEAQSTVSYTETDLNNLLIAELQSRNVSFEPYIDLKPGRVVITAETSVNGIAINVRVVLVPSVDNGYLAWVVLESVVVADVNMDDTINPAVIWFIPAWRSVASKFTMEGVESVRITETQMTITLTGEMAEIPEVMVEEVELEEVNTNTQVIEYYFFTEAQANETFAQLFENMIRVENPMIDFQRDTVVISATLELRRRSFDIQIVLSVVDGETVIWELTGATVNGVSASESDLALINDDVVLAWERFINQQFPVDQIVGFEVFDDYIVFAIAFTVAPQG